MNKCRRDQDDGIYYILDSMRCVKIHIFEQDLYREVFVEFRKYKQNQQTRKLQTKWLEKEPDEMEIKNQKELSEVILKTE